VIHPLWTVRDKNPQYLPEDDKIIEKRSSDKQGLWWNQANDKVYLSYLDPNGEPYSDGKSYAYIDMATLKDKRYRFIKLYGCNTAGGHPLRRDMIRRYPKEASHYNRGVTDRNLARRVSKTFTNADVTGNAGPNYGTFAPNPEIDVPVTYRTDASGHTSRAIAPADQWKRQ